MAYPPQFRVYAKLLYKPGITTVHDVAEMLGVPETTVQRWLNAKRVIVEQQDRGHRKLLKNRTRDERIADLQRALEDQG